MLNKVPGILNKKDDLIGETFFSTLKMYIFPLDKDTTNGSTKVTLQPGNMSKTITIF